MRKNLHPHPNCPLKAAPKSKPHQYSYNRTPHHQTALKFICLQFKPTSHFTLRMPGNSSRTVSMKSIFVQRTNMSRTIKTGTFPCGFQINGSMISMRPSKCGNSRKRSRNGCRTSYACNRQIYTSLKRQCIISTTTFF